MDQQLEQSDLAGQQHWDAVYAATSVAAEPFAPHSYEDRVLAEMLIREIKRTGARTVLEVGCGASGWLGYLARTTGVTVSGIDYSPGGCELARRRLKGEGVSGTIHCADLFTVDPEEVGQHDLVFSLGVVEHFADLRGVLSRLSTFVRPGGWLLTEVPNLRSVHGLLSWIWQPELLAKHEIFTKEELARAYRRVGLQQLHGDYRGTLSLGVVPWELYPRWPRLVKIGSRVGYGLSRRVGYVMKRLGWYRGFSAVAPFFYIAGRRPPVCATGSVIAAGN